MYEAAEEAEDQEILLTLYSVHCTTRGIYTRGGFGIAEKFSQESPGRSNTFHGMSGIGERKKIL